MGRFALVLIMFVTMAPAVAVAQSRDDPVSAPLGTQQVVEMPDLQLAILAAINDLRQSKGLSRLRPSRALVSTAVGHSLSMAKHGFFGHEGYDGSEFWKRIKARYRPGPRGSWEVGENLLWASPSLSAEQAVALWLQSPPHRKNLLSGAWREIGLGAVHAVAATGVYQGLDVTVLTADFGRR
jgi:uncharacterized protein YkwD